MRTSTVAVFAVFVVFVAALVGWGTLASDAGVETVFRDGASAVTSRDDFSTQDAVTPELEVVPQTDVVEKRQAGTAEVNVRIADVGGTAPNVALQVWTTGQEDLDVEAPNRIAVPVGNRLQVLLYRPRPGTNTTVAIDVGPADRTGRHTLHAILLYWIDGSRGRIEQTTTVVVRCSLGCRVVDSGIWLWEHRAFVIAFLSLLVAFFGREKIRSALERTGE